VKYGSVEGVLSESFGAGNSPPTEVGEKSELSIDPVEHSETEGRVISLRVKDVSEWGMEFDVFAHTNRDSDLEYVGIAQELSIVSDQ
jgi:hypothetical protein